MSTENAMAATRLQPLVSWRPGGAQGNKTQQFCDGDQMLVAVQYHSRHKPGQLLYEYRIIVANVDPELGADLVGVDDSDWGWTWDDVEWWLPMSEFRLPQLAVGAGTIRESELKSRVSDVARRIGVAANPAWIREELERIVSAS